MKRSAVEKSSEFCWKETATIRHRSSIKCRTFEKKYSKGFKSGKCEHASESSTGKRVSHDRLIFEEEKLTFLCYYLSLALPFRRF